MILDALDKPICSRRVTREKEGTLNCGTRGVNVVGGLVDTTVLDNMTDPNVFMKSAIVDSTSPKKDERIMIGT